ncbi:hypothetical protein HDU93_001453 [Gonapodya sp. JEL0774]|nr:hypothetical protein HDU93_001453 [Gonapodya sp. JEL0774]
MVHSEDSFQPSENDCRTFLDKLWSYRQGSRQRDAHLDACNRTDRDLKLRDEEIAPRSASQQNVESYAIVLDKLVTFLWDSPPSNDSAEKILTSLKYLHDLSDAANEKALKAEMTCADLRAELEHLRCDPTEKSLRTQLQDARKRIQTLEATLSSTELYNRMTSSLTVLSMAAGGEDLPPDTSEVARRMILDQQETIAKLQLQIRYLRVQGSSRIPEESDVLVRSRHGALLEHSEVRSRDMQLERGVAYLEAGGAPNSDAVDMPYLELVSSGNEREEESSARYLPPLPSTQDLRDRINDLTSKLMSVQSKCSSLEESGRRDKKTIKDLKDELKRRSAECRDIEPVEVHESTSSAIALSSVRGVQLSTRGNSEMFSQFTFHNSIHNSTDTPPRTRNVRKKLPQASQHSLPTKAQPTTTMPKSLIRSSSNKRTRGEEDIEGSEVPTKHTKTSRQPGVRIVECTGEISRNVPTPVSQTQVQSSPTISLPQSVNESDLVLPQTTPSRSPSKPAYSTIEGTSRIRELSPQVAQPRDPSASVSSSTITTLSSRASAILGLTATPSWAQSSVPHSSFQTESPYEARCLGILDTSYRSAWSWTMPVGNPLQGQTRYYSGMRPEQPHSHGSDAGGAELAAHYGLADHTWVPTGQIPSSQYSTAPSPFSFTQSPNFAPPCDSSMSGNLSSFSHYSPPPMQNYAPGPPPRRPSPPWVSNT